MMVIHALVEGPSEKDFLDRWGPRFLAGGCELRVHPHQGKGRLPANKNAQPDRADRSLLNQLPAKLRGFAESLNPETEGVLVLVDADDEDCVALKNLLTGVAQEFAPEILTIVRVAVEETEAFYLGDLRALRSAYDGADMTLAQTYVPDSVCETWEFFGRVVGDDGGRKRDWAVAMGDKLSTNPAQNRSPSFKALCRGLQTLATPRPKKKKRKRNYRHVAKTAKKKGKK